MWQCPVCERTYKTKAGAVACIQRHNMEMANASMAMAATAMQIHESGERMREARHEKYKRRKLEGK